jgi:hypothetical protein
MGPVGFERLVDDLTRNPEPPPGVAPAETPSVNQPAGDGATSPPAPTGNGATGGAGASSELPPGQAAAAAPAQPTNGVGAAPPATPTLPTASGSRFLEIRRGERELIKTLFPLVPSPRAAKRLVNVYRLLRALVPPEERARFEADGTGEYRAALLLLGIQCGYPGPAADLIDDLLDNRPAGHWWGYVEALQRRHPPGQAEDDEAWRDLFRRLAEVRPRLGALPRCPTFVRWAPEVGRYSFRSGRVLVAR